MFFLLHTASYRPVCSPSTFFEANPRHYMLQRPSCACRLLTPWSTSLSRDKEPMGLTASCGPAFLFQGQVIFLCSACLYIKWLPQRGPRPSYSDSVKEGLGFLNPKKGAHCHACLHCLLRDLMVSGDPRPLLKPLTLFLLLRKKCCSTQYFSWQPYQGVQWAECLHPPLGLGDWYTVFCSGD